MQVVRPPPWADYFSGQKCLVLASVWQEDFDALKPSLKMLAEEFPQWRILVTPHEPHQEVVERWQRWLESEGIKTRRWSAWLKNPERESALIVDAVGFLAELYRIASLVFVGGSFKSRVHNVLEPAAYGCPVITGPLISNSAEASEMSRRDLGLIRTESAENLAQEFRKLLSDNLRCDRYRGKLQSFLEEKRGAGRRYAELLLAPL
jgi:3-deoxy-D-manno-octulosonic-acid transferase